MITLPYSKIELAVGTDESRPTLQSVYYDAKKGRLVATDGFILAVIPIIPEEDVSGHIPVEAIKAARKASKRAYIDAVSEAQVYVQDDHWQRPDYQYPNFDQIVPKFENGSVTVNLDARRLMQLAEALLQEEDRAKRKGKKADQWGVSLTFDPEKAGSPVMVRPLYDTGLRKGRFGLIMPIYKPGKPL